VFASGLRNPGGMDWETQTGALWTAVNERDELGSDLVPDYMTSVKDGGFYGWPFSYYGPHVDTRVPANPDMVAKAIVPDYALGNHAASLGLAFYQADLFPPQFRGGAFVGQHGTLFGRCVKSPLDFHDVVLTEATDLDYGARRIRVAAPQLRLHRVDDRAQARHVGDVNDEPHRVAQRRSFGFGDQFHVEKCPTDARLVARNERAGRRINAAHAGDEDEIPGARADAPGAGRLDRAGGRESLDAVRRQLFSGGRAGGKRAHCLLPDRKGRPRDFVAPMRELSLNLGDGRGQAAAA